MSRSTKLWTNFNQFGSQNCTDEEVCRYEKTQEEIGASVVWTIPGVSDFNLPLAEVAAMPRLREATDLIVAAYSRATGDLLGDLRVESPNGAPLTILDLYKTIDQLWKKWNDSPDHCFLEGFVFNRHRKTDGSGWVTFVEPFFGS